MSAEYFARTLTFWEAVLFAHGVRRRYRTPWETARHIAFYAAAPHCKDFGFEKMGRFPWEEVQEEPVDEETRLKKEAELREYIKKRDELFKYVRKENGNG
jgi:hypothetical protein